MSEEDAVEEIFRKPEIFKLIQPRGIKARPEKQVFDLKNEIQLNVSDTDPIIKKYRAALKLLIGEMKRKGVGF